MIKMKIKIKIKEMQMKEIKETYENGVYKC